MKCQYAYVKNGDVIKQIKILVNQKNQFHGGANEFVGDFLRAVEGQSICLSSRFYQRDDYQDDHLIAKVFPKAIGSSGVFGKLLGSIAGFFGLLKFLIAHKPERILCGSLGSQLWACFLISKIYSIPLVHSRHSCGGTMGLSRFKTYFDNWCIRRIRGVVCHGPYLKTLIQSIGVPVGRIYEFDVNLLHVQKNLKQTSLSLPQPLLNKTDSEVFKKILYVGRIEAGKGVFDLFNACVELLHKDSNLRLIYVGTGSNIDQLKEKIEAENLQNQVVLLGSKPHDEIPVIMQECDILVAATRTFIGEGRCMSVMESMVAGTPVIAPNHTAFPFLIKDGVNGLLYEPDSANDLNKKISKVLYDDSFHFRLKEGAAQYGLTLLEPPMTFSQAVFKAFKNKH